ncbi:hypothetical protein U1Q18_011257 [Sarracenia purpurea var. burkii]
MGQVLLSPSVASVAIFCSYALSSFVCPKSGSEQVASWLPQGMAEFGFPNHFQSLPKLAAVLPFSEFCFRFSCCLSGTEQVASGLWQALQMGWAGIWKSSWISFADGYGFAAG